MTMRSLTLAAVLAFTLAAVPIASGQGEAVGRKTDPGITNGTKQHKLDAARKTWKAARVSSYSYAVAVSCFCPPQDDYRVVVRGGRPAAGTPDGVSDLATVPRLFRTIQQAIDGKVTKINVTYGTRGVPRSIYIDRDQRISDEETGYTIKRFTPLAKRSR